MKINKKYKYMVEAIENYIWKAVIRCISKDILNRNLIKYSDYNDKISDIFNSIEALAIDIEDDLILLSEGKDEKE
jgi:hypothetical protein